MSWVSLRFSGAWPSSSSQQGDLLAPAQGAVDDTADGEAPEVVGGVEVGDDGLQRRVEVALGRRDRGDDGLEQRGEVVVVAGHADAGDGLAVAGDGRDDRELDGVLVGVEVEEELVDLVEDLVGAGVLAVDLVEHDHGGQPGGQRLGEHVAGLGQRALGGVDEQHHAVDHRQRPLDLTTEVGVAGGVDEVDPDAVPLDRGGLGEDGDAPLALLVVGVHDPVDEGGVLAEGARRTQEGIDQGGLAVVDVGDERDVAQRGGSVFAGGHEEEMLSVLGPLRNRWAPERGYQAFSSASLSYMHHEAWS